MTRKSSARAASSAGVSIENEIEFARGDVRDEALLARLLDGVEVVFHQAAVPSVPRSVAEPLRTNSVNVGGTLQVLESARRAGVRRLVFAASSSANFNN